MTVQLEFEFDELPKEIKAEEQKPALPRFDAPECDNERLLNWQHEYRTAGDAGALGRMYALGRRVALRYINAIASGNRHVAEMGADEKEEKAHNAITYIIARYLRKEDFAIRESFTAYLYLRVKHELFYRRKVDGIVDFVDMETLTGSFKRQDGDLYDGMGR